ncbi:MAG: mevalonate kinase, partial [Candidatus Bathyarchaeia archaeon]
LKKLYPEVVESIMDTGDKIASLAIETFKRGDLASLGNLMNINHALLYAVGVSSWTIEELVWAARKAGALGAKLTGAGGGGCIIALSMPEKMHHVAEAIKMAGGAPFFANMAFEGVRVEE